MSEPIPAAAEIHAATMPGTESWEDELLAPPPTPCAACSQDLDRHWMPLLLRRWPLDGRMLCARCWGAQAATDVVEQWQQPGRGVTVHTRHPDGDILRGTIRPVGAGQPPRWMVTDADANSLGVHASDYVDALAVLLGHPEGGAAHDRVGSTRDG